VSYLQSIYASDGTLDLFLIGYALLVFLVADRINGAARDFLRKYNWWINIVGMSSVAYLYSGRTDVAIAWGVVGALAGFTSALVWSVSESDRSYKAERKIIVEKILNGDSVVARDLSKETARSSVSVKPQLIQNEKKNITNYQSVVDSKLSVPVLANRWQVCVDGVRNINSNEFISCANLQRISNDSWKGLYIRGGASSVIWIPDEQLRFDSTEIGALPWMTQKNTVDELKVVSSGPPARGAAKQMNDIESSASSSNKEVESTNFKDVNESALDQAWIDEVKKSSQRKSPDR
jgi:hypothetical protein